MSKQVSLFHNGTQVIVKLAKPMSSVFVKIDDAEFIVCDRINQPVILSNQPNNQPEIPRKLYMAEEMIEDE